jgi:hypothetical protein
MPGSGELVLSRQLGDVMKESACQPVSTLREVLALGLEARERAIAA